MKSKKITESNIDDSIFNANSGEWWLGGIDSQGISPLHAGIGKLCLGPASGSTRRGWILPIFLGCSGESLDYRRIRRCGRVVIKVRHQGQANAISSEAREEFLRFVRPANYSCSA